MSIINFEQVDAGRASSGTKICFVSSKDAILGQIYLHCLAQTIVFSKTFPGKDPMHVFLQGTLTLLCV